MIKPSDINRWLADLFTWREYAAFSLGMIYAAFAVGPSAVSYWLIVLLAVILLTMTGFGVWVDSRNTP